MEEYNGIILSGLSGVGKTTASGKLFEIDRRLKKLVTTTSRPPRPGETEGIDYYFAQRQVIEQWAKENKMLEWAEVYGNIYGSTWDEYMRVRNSGCIPYFVVDVQGARTLRSKLHAYSIFLLPPSMSELYHRLESDRNRNDSPEQIAVRFAKAKDELRELPYFDAFVVNDVLEETVEKLRRVIESAFPYTDRKP